MKRGLPDAAKHVELKGIAVEKDKEFQESFKKTTTTKRLYQMVLFLGSSIHVQNGLLFMCRTIVGNPVLRV